MDFISPTRIFVSVITLVTVTLLTGCSKSEPPSPVLEIGNQKQLFIDDFVVASTQGVSRVLHPLQRYSDNPVIVGDAPGERWSVSPNGRATLFDEESNEFKMWYMSSQIDPEAYGGIQYRASYAVSQDGYHWTKPHLGLVEWEGSRENNMLPSGTSWMRRANVIKDDRDPDPNRRFKMTYVDIFDGQSAVTKAYSTDGIHWALNGDGKPWFRKPHNGNLLGWDPRVEEFIFYVRMPGSPNLVGRATSFDFVTWSEAQTVLQPNADEPHKHFKGLAAFLYEGVYLGWIWVFEKSGDDWVRADSELAFSRDGIQWKRPFPGRFILSKGETGSWDSHLSIPVAPIAHDGKLWTYYWGENIPYGAESLKRIQEGWVEAGQRKQRAVGLAQLRLDGFVSLKASTHDATITTRVLLPGQGQLTVNANVRGELRVSMLDNSGQPFPGFGAGNSDPVKTDAQNHVIRWKGNPSLDQLQGQPIRIRFHLRDADLYAFQFVSAQ